MYIEFISTNAIILRTEMKNVLFKKNKFDLNIFSMYLTCINIMPFYAKLKTFL